MPTKHPRTIRIPTNDPSYPTGITGEPCERASYVYDDDGVRIGRLWKDGEGWCWSLQDDNGVTVSGGQVGSRDKAIYATVTADERFRRGEIQSRPPMTVTLPVVEENPDA